MSLRFLLPTLLGLVLLLPSTAAAGTAITPNACLNSADITDTFRQQNGFITATASSSAAEVLPGQPVTLSAGTFDFEIPEYLIKDGYAVGLLNAGPNTISIKGWVAIRATNTVEGVRLVGPVTVEATTSVTVDPLDNAYVSSTPPVYTRPALPATTWTATGGDVVFSQAEAGAFGSLPLNPGGGARRVAGSLVAQMFFNGGTTVNSVFDCRPGKVISEEYEGVGPTFTPQPAAAIDRVAGPQNVTCLSATGPELQPARVELSADPFPAGYVNGTPYTLTGTRAKLTLTPETVKALTDLRDGGTPLIAPGKAYPVGVWVTLAGANTTQGTQTLPVSATYTLREAGAAELTVELPDTTWTPNGAGELRFTAGAPGSMPAQTFVGPADGAPGGAVVTTTYTAAPYGSVVLRLGTEANAVTLDCAQAWFTVAEPAIAYSNLGRLGSQGRYLIRSAAQLPPLTEQPAIAPPPPAGGGGTAPPPGQSLLNQPPVLPGPPRIDRVPASGSIASSALKRDKRGRAVLTVRCPATASVACAGTLRVRSAAKVRIGRRSRVITVVGQRGYRVAPGRSATLRLTLSRDGRSALRSRKRLKVRVELTPASGAAVRRTLTLR